MKPSFFPQKEFRAALSVTAKLKQQLQPFVEEVSKNNIEWTFFMCSQLYQYLTLDCEIIYKFNSLAAIKLLMDKCQFTIFLIAEVYFLPFILKIASYQLNAPEKSRGIDYFTSTGYQKTEQAKKLGYNYVRLACELISFFAVVKPNKFFKVQQLPEPSDFRKALEHIKQKNWKEYDSLVFFSQNPLVLREVYEESIQRFYRDTSLYEKFIRDSLDNILRKDLQPIGLDVRKILESYEAHACSCTFNLLKTMMSKESQAVTFINVFKLMTDFVRWGNMRAFHLIEVEGIFDRFLKHIILYHQQSAQEKPMSIFDFLQGEEEKLKLYTEVMKSIQVWTVCIAKNLKDSKSESKVTNIYKTLKNDLNLQFPYLGNLKNIRNECFQNLQKYKRLNQQELNLLKTKEVLQQTMRRSSFELKQLMATTNNNKHMKEVFQQERVSKRVKTFSRDKNSNFADELLSITMEKDFKGLLKENQSKGNTFAQSFFKEKKKKKPSRVSAISPLHSQLNSSQSFSYQDHGSPNKMSKFQKQIARVKQEVDNILTEETLNTDYSSQFEEENEKANVKQMKMFKGLQYRKNLQDQKKKDQLKNKLKSSKENNTGQSKMKSEASIYQFFDQSNISSISSISNDSKSVKGPQIIIKSPSKTTLQAQSKFFNQLSSKQILLSENTTFKKMPTFADYQVLQQKLVSLQAQKQELQKELSNKDEGIVKDSKHSIKRQKSGDLDSQFNWSIVLKSEEELSRTNHAKDSCKSVSVIYQDSFEKYLQELRGMDSKKLLKNKDLLMKNSHLEIGFIFELRKKYAELTLFLTPQRDLDKVFYEIRACKNVSIKEQSQRVVFWEKKKQKKIIFKCTVQTPYSLPEFVMKYQVPDGTSHSLNMLLPLSFNKFIQFEHEELSNQKNLIIRSTAARTLNRKLFKTSDQLLRYFPDLRFSKQDNGLDVLTGSFILQKRKCAIKIQINSQKVVNICYSMQKEDDEVQRSADFLVLTLFNVISK